MSFCRWHISHLPVTVKTTASSPQKEKAINFRKNQITEVVMNYSREERALSDLGMAVKDPDHEVCICVVRTLEKLKGSQSYEFLEKFKQDPDSRVRKYTNWALERLDSLAME
jgi:hypothetical protein